MSERGAERKKLLLFELNEFSRDLMRDASKSLGLGNLARLLALRESVTVSPDTYESDYLEPWVQWVSIHTGTPSSSHRIKHLGDVPDLGTPQIWEALSRKGVTTGIWGAMNASRNGDPNCLFFLPDPWTFSEPGYPAELNSLLEFPRLVAKNYLKLPKRMLAARFAKFLGVFMRARAGRKLLARLPALARDAIRFKGEHFVFISFTDEILTELFIDYRRKHDPQFTVLFLNSLAHMQHHHWHGTDYAGNSRIVHCLRVMDRIAGRVLASLDPGETIVMINGLSQINTNRDRPWVLYRQFDQASFLRTVGVTFARVEPHMTHDAHIFFASEADRDRGVAVLKSITVQGQPMFLIETYDTDRTKIFYRIQFTDELGDGAQLSIGEGPARGSVPFGAHFEAIVTRTGKHIPVGSAFSNLAALPDRLANHELFGHLVSHFDRSG